MKACERILSREDLLYLPKIGHGIATFGGPLGSDNDVCYRELGEFLLVNVTALNLDECIQNLSRFAVGVAVEISEKLRVGDSVFANGNHWEWRPVITKQQGKNAVTSDVRSKEKQVACMLDVLAYQLKRDPSFANGALSLGRHIQANGLWSAEDVPDVD